MLTEVLKWALAGLVVALAVFGLVDLLGGGTSATDAAEEKKCESESAEVETGDGEIKPRIVLQPDTGSQERVVNFGNDRDPEPLSFRIKSDPALPPDLEQSLDLTADTFTRTGNANAESVTFPEPTFSKVEPSLNRERVTFTVCLAPPPDLPAGKYTGLVTLDGPPGVEGPSVSIVANAKDETMFYLGGALTLILAVLVLLYKGTADRRAAHIDALPPGANEPDRDKAESWKTAREETLKDVGWVAPMIFAVVATAGSLYALYANDPAWGAEGVGSVAALIGAGLAAVGAKAIFSPSR